MSSFIFCLLIEHLANVRLIEGFHGAVIEFTQKEVVCLIQIHRNPSRYSVMLSGRENASM